MDPILPVLECTQEIAQQKFLHALEDSVTNVEFTAYLTMLNNNKSKMSEVDSSKCYDSCLQEEESTASPQLTANKRQRSALARFVKKIKQRAIAKRSARSALTARAEALEDNRRADITPGVEAWKAWNSTSDVGDAFGVCLTSSSSAGLIDLPTWLDRRRERSSEYEGLGYSTTVSAFAALRQRISAQHAHCKRVDNRQPNASERRRAERARRELRMKEYEEECYTVFKKFDTLTISEALEDSKSRSKVNEKEALNKLKAAMPTSKTIVTKEAMERNFIVDTGTTVSIMSELDMFDDGTPR